MSTVTIWGLLIDPDKTPIGSAFELEIGEMEDIFSFQKKVKETNDDVRDVPYHHLRVWKLCKPRREIDLTQKDFLKAIQLVMHSGNRDRDTTALLLDPEKIICAMGPWPDRQISVLVERPPLDELQAVHNRSWGRRWSTRKGTIHTTPSDDMMNIPVTPALGGSGDRLIMDPCTPVSPGEYTCLANIQSFTKAFPITTSIPDVIVVRDEYIKLRQELEESQGSFVLTGHPGIGMTIFLIYLLLYRLERELPTAIEFGPSEYIFFNENGPKVHRSSNSKLPDSCWALSDSNADVKRPCLGFRASGARVIQATSQSEDEWKDWVKYAKMCSIIIVDLPTPLEIAAIAQEMGYDPSTALTLVNKWGPCTRTIVKMLLDSSFTEVHTRRVESAALRFSRDNSVIQACDDAFEMDGGISSLLFVFPIRDPRPSCKFGRYIPTAELVLIYSRFQG